MTLSLEEQRRMLAEDLLTSWGISVRIDNRKNAPQCARMKWENIVSGANDRKTLLPHDEGKDDETTMLMMHLKVADKRLSAFKNAKRRAHYEIAKLRYVDCRSPQYIAKQSKVSDRTVAYSIQFIKDYILTRHSYGELTAAMA